MKRPWFANRAIGTLPLPISIEGWGATVSFIVAVAATALSQRRSVRNVYGASKP